MGALTLTGPAIVEQGINGHEVHVVGINGKLTVMTEAGALWSTYRGHGLQ